MINSQGNPSNQQQHNPIDHRQNRTQSPQILEQLNSSIKQPLNMKLQTCYNPLQQFPQQSQQQKQKFITTVKKSNNDQNQIAQQDQNIRQGTNRNLNEKEFGNQQRFRRYQSNSASKNNKQLKQLNEQNFQQSIKVFLNDNQLLSNKQRVQLQQLLNKEEERDFLNHNINQNIEKINQNEKKTSKSNIQQLDNSSQQENEETIKNSLSYTFAISNPLSNNIVEIQNKNNTFNQRFHSQQGQYIKTDGDLPKGESDIYIKQENQRQLWNRLLPYLEKPHQLKNNRQNSQHNQSSLIYNSSLDQLNQGEETLHSKNDVSLNTSGYCNTSYNIENINQRPLPLIHQKKLLIQQKNIQIKNQQMKEKLREKYFQLDSFGNGYNQNHNSQQGRNQNLRSNNRTSSVTPEKSSHIKNDENNSQYNKSHANSFLIQNNCSFNIQREYMKSSKNKYYPNSLNTYSSKSDFENNGDLIKQYHQCSELLQIVSNNLNKMASNINDQRASRRNSQPKKYEIINSNKSDQIIITNISNGKTRKKNFEKMKLPSLYITRHSPSLKNLQNSKEYNQKMRSNSVNRQYDNIQKSEFNNSYDFSNQVRTFKKQEQIPNDMEYKQDFQNNHVLSQSNFQNQSVSQQQSSKSSSLQNIHKILNQAPTNNEQIFYQTQDISQSLLESVQVSAFENEQNFLNQQDGQIQKEVIQNNMTNYYCRSQDKLVPYQQNKDIQLNSYQCNCQKQKYQDIQEQLQNKNHKQEYQIFENQQQINQPNYLLDNQSKQLDNQYYEKEQNQNMKYQQEVIQQENKNYQSINSPQPLLQVQNKFHQQSQYVSPNSKQLQSSQLSSKSNFNINQKESPSRIQQQRVENMNESQLYNSQVQQKQNYNDQKKIEKYQQRDIIIGEGNDEEEDEQKMQPLSQQIKNIQKGKINKDLQDIQVNIQFNRYIGNLNCQMTFGLINDLQQQNLQIKFSKRFDENNKIFQIERLMNVFKLPVSLRSNRQFLTEKNKYNETQFFECNDCCIETRTIENYNTFNFKQYLITQYFNQQVSKNITRESSCIDIKQIYIYHDEEFYQRDVLLVEYEKFETLDELIQNRITNKQQFTEYELLVSYLQLLNNYQQLINNNIVHQNINATKIAYSYSDCQFKFMPLSKAHVYNFDDFSPRDTMTDKFMIQGDNDSHPVWIDLVNLGIVFCQMKVLDSAQNKSVLEKINTDDQTISKQIIQMLCNNFCENTIHQCIELIYQNFSATSFFSLILQPISFEIKNDFEKCKKMRIIAKSYESIHQLKDACDIFTQLVEMKEKIFGKNTDEYFQALCDELFAFYKDGQIQKIQGLYDRCQEYLKIIPSLPQSVSYLHYFAEIQWRLGKEQESEDFFNRAFKIISTNFDKIDSCYMTNIYNNKGVNELSRDCIEKSVQYFEESLRYCYQQPQVNQMMLSSIYNNLSISLLKLNRLEESLDYMLKSLEIKKEIEVLNIDPENSKMAYAISILYKSAKNDINKSLEYIDMALKLQEHHQNHLELMKYYYKKTQLHFEQNQQQQGIEAANHVLPLIDKCDLPTFRQIIQIAFDIGCLFKNKKLKDQAKYFFSKAFDVGFKLVGPQVLAVQQIKKELDALN